MNRLLETIGEKIASLRETGRRISELEKKATEKGRLLFDERALLDPGKIEEDFKLFKEVAGELGKSRDLPDQVWIGYGERTHEVRKQVREVWGRLGVPERIVLTKEQMRVGTVLVLYNGALETVLALGGVGRETSEELIGELKVDNRPGFETNEELFGRLEIEGLIDERSRGEWQISDWGREIVEGLVKGSRLGLKPD